MELFLVTFFVMALAVSGMAIGVVFGRSPIAGSCGGLGAIDGSGRCQSCSRPCRSARRRDKRSNIQESLHDGRDGRDDSTRSTNPVTIAELRDFREPGNY